MRAPTAAELLNVWENGLRQGPIDRALGLLEAVYPEQSAEALAELSIGDRDSRLLQVRQVLFGPRLTSTTRCPRCSERLEWESEVAEFRVQEGIASTTEFCLDVERYRIKFKLPNSRDLAALCKDEDGINDRRTQLMERCLVEASTSEGEPLRIEQLSDTALQAMVREMDRADPQSNLQVHLTCPACGHCWEGLFDIVSFLWAELENWADHTLRTVHLLASAYGWREADILAMRPTRRRIYLEMARQ